MDLSKCNVGMAITGSFCTFDKIKIEIKKMVEMGINVYPIFSPCLLYTSDAADE